MRTVKIGAPGFILANEISKDLKGTLRRIADMGFDGLEITGFFGHSAEALRDAFAEVGLEPFGCYAIHTMLLGVQANPLPGWEPFLKALAVPGETPDDRMEYLREIGCRYIGLCMTNTEPSKETLRQIEKTAALAKKHGMRLQYHNHDWEYINMTDRDYRMDRILRSVSDDLLFEPDLGWMGIGGYAPMEALKAYRDRIEIVHLKDYYREGPNALDRTKPFEFRPTGYGVMDWASILSYCEREIQPVWYVADHDKACRADCYTELEQSLTFIRNALQYT